MNIKRLKISLRNALNGISYVFSREQNFQIELLSALLVVGVMFLVDLEKWEIVVLFMTIFSILVLEILNTVLERLIDLLNPRIHVNAGKLKDIMAGAVFLASIGAIIIGLIIFLPYI